MHTPGPWEARRDPCHFGALSSVVGGAQAGGVRLNRELMVEVGGHGTLQIQEANTRLIAAAPDLLEALEELKGMLLEWHDDMPDHVGDAEAGAIEKARKAIAKAKGETV